MDPWERQRGESSQAFAAFVVYRDMGGKRSLRETAREVGKTHALISRWASAWRWVERCHAWDREVDRQAREAQFKAVSDMKRRHAEESVALQKKAFERLRQLEPSELSPQDVLRFFVEAAKLERLSRGEPETVTVEEQRGTVEHKHEHDITHRIEQYAEVYQKLAERGPTDGDDAGDRSGEPLDPT